MNPKAFLETYWRMELRPQVFVAMSFAPQYADRFAKVIKPAVRMVKVGDTLLEPHRVDVSKTGDSILTDIIDGVCHSQIVLADVSSVGKDSVTGEPYRNANVLYEVGLALACRDPSEVLLVRDDHHRFLFDVSTIPHMTLDFTDTERAKKALAEALVQRLNERQLTNDIRVRRALAGLTPEEIAQLTKAADYADNIAWGRSTAGRVDFFGMAALPRLLDKGVIQVVAKFKAGHPAYMLTPLGRIVATLAKGGLPILEADDPNRAAEADGPASVDG